MVESLVKYPNSVTQTTGGSYVTFSNISNIKNSSTTSYAESSTNIKAKNSSPNRPSTVSCSNFSFNLPTGAEIVDVTVYYRHVKLKVGSTVCNIPAPTISLLGVSGFSGKGSAPTTTTTSFTKTFSGSALTRAVVNSSSFGVKIDYPANTNSYEGKVRIIYVRLLLHYKLPSYTVSVKKAEGGYNKEEYAVECSISNKNLTSYNPTLTLSAPAGFSYKRAEGTGTATKVNNRTITWNPSLTSKTGTSTIRMVFDTDVTYPAGTSTYTGTFTLVESLNSTTGNLTATITDRPVTEEETSPDAPPVIDDETPTPEATTVIKNEEFYYEMVLTDSEYEELVDLVYEHQAFLRIWGNKGSITDPTEYEDTSTFLIKDEFNTWAAYRTVAYTSLDSNHSILLNCKARNLNEDKLVVDIMYYTISGTDLIPHYIRFREYPINIVPLEEDLTTPFLSILEPTEEECDRLGNGYSYICQSDMKHSTTDTFNRDWYKNNRVGIFNNRLKPIITDVGTTSNHNDIWTLSNATLTRNASDSTLLETTATGYAMNNSYNKIPPNSVVEFDICQTDGASNSAPIYIRNDGGGTSLSSITYDNLGASIGDWVHIKMVFNNTDTITVYSDKLSESFTKTLSATSTNYRVMFYCGGDMTTIKFKNFVVYPVIDNLSSQQIFENAEYWSNTTAGLNDYNSVECEFTYNSDYPLYVLMTGDYPEATTYGFDIGEVSFTEPCIIEKNSYNGRETNGNYPIHIENLLSDTDMSTITLQANETGTPVRLYDFPLSDDYGTNEELAIRGIQVTGTLESTDNLIVYAKLIKPNGEIGQRSIVLNTNDTNDFSIGELGDLWGFTTLQMTNLEDWQIELSASNILATGESYLNIQDVQIIFYIETIDKQQIRISIDGEDIAYYGAFIESVNIPEGLETDTSFITVDGTDMNDAYRQNIREKTIEIYFNISECDLKTSTDLLRQITKLFVNEKDQYNRPIPKRITFSHYPEDYFEYIMETPFEVSTEITDYNVTAKLTIPAGTSYSRTDTVTNTVGNANGLAALRPIITIQPSSANIEIKEALSEQSFNMTYTGDWTDKIVEINCDDRQVLLKDDADDDGIDISKYVDHNSDWFRLSGEFNFEAINCVIRTVSFNERW